VYTHNPQKQDIWYINRLRALHEYQDNINPNIVDIILGNNITNLDAYDYFEEDIKQLGEKILLRVFAHVFKQGNKC
jgi:uncharacterized sporulation protein YeaH/YhbH (DUF444 family)